VRLVRTGSHIVGPKATCLLRDEDADAAVSDNAVQAILAAADAAIQNHRASAPLLRLRATIEQLD
jgi:hypothetical protein